jgi:glycosyltransferase involved in cell wall biosynthesis
VSPPTATVAVTTRNRRDELRILLESAAAQSCSPELLVIDDGSTDGTAEMVAAEFPAARVDRTERSLGLIEQRNRAARLAGGDVIVSIDDDARFPSPSTVEQSLRDFDHPRIGAVAIPFVDIRTSTSVRQEPPDREGRWITSSYIGTAHALRRDVFLAVGGYRGGLAQMVEEPDYCLRMLDAGFVTRLGRGERIVHEESAKRDQRRITALGRRNDLLHGWHNVPMPYLLARLAKITAYSAVYPDARRHPGAVLSGLAAGYSDMWRLRHARDPVRRATYRLDHDLRKRGPLRLEEIEHRLQPAPDSVPAGV